VGSGGAGPARPGPDPARGRGVCARHAARLRTAARQGRSGPQRGFGLLEVTALATPSLEHAGTRHTGRHFKGSSPARPALPRGSIISLFQALCIGNALHT
jgi:hypothetical protein